MPFAGSSGGGGAGGGRGGRGGRGGSRGSVNMGFADEEDNLDTNGYPSSQRQEHCSTSVQDSISRSRSEHGFPPPTPTLRVSKSTNGIISNSNHQYHKHRPSSVLDDKINNSDLPDGVDSHHFTITSQPLTPILYTPEHSLQSSPQLVGYNNNNMRAAKGETIQMETIGESVPHQSKDSYYFDDCVRTIDYILVYTKIGRDAKSEVTKISRKNYEHNLLEEGLQLEHTKDRDETGLKFVKLHAPWSVLIRYAEIMKLKMPMRQMETSWRLVFDEDDPYSKGKFTCAYTKDKEYLFDIPAQKERFFSTSQRSQIVEFILKRKSFSSIANDASSFGINKLLQDGVYLAAYPLHEGMIHSSSAKNESPRMQLLHNWASVTRMFVKQPLDDIRKYFGVKIALYFAWLGFYTSMLIPASLVGVLCFVYGCATLMSDKPTNDICNKLYDNKPMCPLCSINCQFSKMSESCIYARVSYMFDNPATVFFAVFMSLWATVYLEMWKRYSARITYRWDLSNFDKYEEYPRPEYLARLTRAEKKKLNVITRMYEPYVPFWKKQLPYTILSMSSVLFLIFTALASVLGVIVYRVAIRTVLSKSGDDKVKNYSSLIASATAAGINLLCIMIFNAVYSKVAHYLTELEMPRTQTDFDNSLTLKMYLLQFINYYSSIFYIAFFKGRFVSHPGELEDNSSVVGRTQEECGPGGCLVELAIQLAIIMVGKQALNAIMEMAGPWVQWCIHRWKLRSKVEHKSGPTPQWEDDFFLGHWGPQALFYEYLEMVLQFGFVTVFVAAFPLAPLFALINNALEIRLDARKMITAFRRPVSQRVKNIGIWYRILDSIGKMSVITNAVIIAFTSDFIPRLLYYNRHSTMEGYLNSTLSTYNISTLTSIFRKANDTTIRDFLANGTTQCWYQGNRNPPEHKSLAYHPNLAYWELLAVRLAFVFVFENVIAVVTMVLRWLIPDVPRTLRQHIRQHGYLTNELIMQQELKRAKELGVAK